MPTPNRRPNRFRTALAATARFVLVLCVVLNGLIIVQARAATHFVTTGGRPELVLSMPLHRQVAALITGVPVARPENRTTPADHYLPYETVMIGLADGEQLEAWHVSQPQPRGIALMFVGYAGAKEGALTPAAKFYQFGYNSLVVDFRGAGGSSRSDQTLGIREADDVAAAFAYVRARWPELPVVLYGISMGGAAVLRAVAVADVQPAGLVLEAVFDELLTTTRHRFDALGLPGSPVSELLLFWGGVQLGLNPFAHNPLEYAAAAEMPVLLLYGEHDPWILPAERDALAAAMAGPTTLVTFAGQGHGGPYVYSDAPRWDAAVRAFLDGL